MFEFLFFYSSLALSLLSLFGETWVNRLTGWTGHSHVWLAVAFAFSSTLFNARSGRAIKRFLKNPANALKSSPGDKHHRLHS